MPPLTNQRLRTIENDAMAADEPLSALFLSESMSDLNEGATFLDRLSMEEVTFIRSRGTTIKAKRGEGIFHQGDSHEGIFLIESGRVRTFCTGPSGRELTLAYWTPGHFIGGPEVFGGVHLWSGEAMEDSRVMALTGTVVRDLIERMPTFALCLIDGLVAKGKCYSQLVQMLGTRSVSQRLAQLLKILGQVHGREEDGGQPELRHSSYPGGSRILRGGRWHSNAGRARRAPAAPSQLRWWHGHICPTAGGALSHWCFEEVNELVHKSWEALVDPQRNRH